MKPLMLKGHERSITRVKYNREGDLLFSSGKDQEPCVWYSVDGERLGSYQGHKGVVWSLDVSWDCKFLLTGSGDNYCMLWDCLTGKRVQELQTPTSVRTVGFSYSGNLFFYTTAAQMKFQSSLNIFDSRDSLQEPQMRIQLRGSALAAVWSHLDDTIITGHEDGQMCQYDIRGSSQEPVNFVSDGHKQRINDLQIAPDQTMLISASKDQSAKLFDAHTLVHLKTYKSERPVNSAAISPIRDHIVLGGGEEAMIVTQSGANQGQFEAKFYHLVFEDEFARIKGHFGPINTLAFHPDGMSYASGAEDGYVRIQSFDPEYYDFDFDQ